MLIFSVQRYTSFHLIPLFWPNISEKKNLFEKALKLLKFIGMYSTKNNVSKKRHRYNQLRCFKQLKSILLLLFMSICQKVSEISKAFLD